MPDPVHSGGVSLSFPKVFTFEALVDFIGLDPVGGDVLLVAATYSTAFGFANLVPDPQFALSVEVDSYHAEVFSLDEGV